MAAVYANLIIKGKKTIDEVPEKIRDEVKAVLIVKGKKNFADVPERIKEQAKEVLIDLECGELAQ